jgi:hypothetical protein
MHKILLFVVLLSTLRLSAQSAGELTFNILNTPFSSRLAVLNQPLSIHDGDVNVGVLNPSKLHSQMHGSLAMNFVDYFSDISFVELAYSFPLKDFGTFSTSIKNISYGEFVQTDFASNQQGVFSANEKLLNFGYGKALFTKWSVGANFKLAVSDLETYQSIAIATDLGLSFFDSKSTWSFSLLARNMGRQVVSYTSTKESLPFVMDFGASKQLEHLPFRFNLGYNNIQRFDLSYISEPVSNSINDDTDQSSISFTNKLFHHFTIGGELTIAKRIDLRFGYNALKRNELKVNSYLGTVGFSWGLGVRLNSFRIDFGRSTYHLHGSPNYFSLSTNLNQFFGK